MTTDAKIIVTPYAQVSIPVYSKRGDDYIIYHAHRWSVSLGLPYEYVLPVMIDRVHGKPDNVHMLTERIKQRQFWAAAAIGVADILGSKIAATMDDQIEKVLRGLS